MTKKWLIGAWRSDAARTRAELEARRDIPPKTRQALRQIFGRLTITYGARIAVSCYDGLTTRQAYRVLACDATSVAIVCRGQRRPETRLYQLVFEDQDHYWICLGKIREFFVRVSAVTRVVSPGWPAGGAR